MPSLTDDNAERLYDESQAHDAAAEQEELLAQERARWEQFAAANAAQSQEVASEGDPDAATSALFESTEPESPSTTADVVKGIARGPIADTADFVDNLFALGDEAGIDIGGEAFNVKNGLTNTLLNLGFGSRENPPTIRTVINEGLGEPETPAGQVAQGISGQLALIIPAMRAVKLAGAIGTATRVIAAPAVVAGATLGQDEGNLSNLATEEFSDSLADNWLTQTLAIDDDDSTFERMMKTSVEDSFLGGSLEVAFRAVGFTLRALRGQTKAARAITEAAERSGATVDGNFSDAAEDVVKAKAQVRLLDAAEESLQKARAQADEAAETAAFRGDADSPVDLSLKALEDVKEKAAQARGTLAQAEGALERAVASTDADGRVIEATRQVLNGDRGVVAGNQKTFEGEDAFFQGKDLSPNTDKTLGDAATARIPEQPVAPVKATFKNLLEVDAADAALVQKHIADGDLDSATDTMATFFDSTNYERIAESDDIKDIIEVFGSTFSGSKQSTRLPRVRGFVETEELANAEVLRLASEAGTTPERILAALDASLPGKNLDVQMNAMRMMEISLAKKVKTISDSLRGGEGGALEEAEFARWSVMLANVNDRRAGVASELGRALSAQRIEASTGGFDDILEASRDFRSAQIKGIVDKAGGSEKIRRAAELVRQSVDADSATEVIKNTVLNHTFGDTLYNAFIANILSGPATQAINNTSNLLRAFVWNPTEKLFEAGTLAIKNRDLGEFKVLSGYLEGLMYGTRAALAHNGSFVEGSAARAFRSGRRITAGDSVKFVEDAPSSLLRSQALGDLVRRGVPTSVPFTAGKRTVNLFPIPQRGRNAIANYLQERSGIGARAIDWLGRVMEYPLKALAAGDELAASINFNGQLAADSVEHARSLGLDGVEFSQMVDQIRRDVPNIQSMIKRADPTDFERGEYLKVLDKLHTAANNSARRGTYTEPEGPILEKLMGLRRSMPAMRWFLPFLRTPTNLLKSGFNDFTPAGAIRELADLKGGGPDAARELAKAQGRLALTGGLVASVWAGIQSGRITGGGPANFAEKEVWEAAGNVPYSIEVPEALQGVLGNRIRINRLDPVAMPMFMLADLMEVGGRMGEEEHDILYGEIIDRLQAQLKSKSYLEGLSTLAHLAEDPDRYARRWVVSTAENVMVPGSRFWAAIDKGGMPIPESWVHQEPGDSEFTGTIKEFLAGDRNRPQRQDEQPGVSGMFLQLGSTIQSDLPPGMSDIFTGLWQKVISAKLNDAQTNRLNFFGETIVIPPGLGPDNITPFFGSNIDEDDPLANEMSRLGLGISVQQRFGTISGVKLTPELQNRYQTLFAKPKGGDTIREVLTRMIFEEDGVTPTQRWEERGDTYGGQVVKGNKEYMIMRRIRSRQNSAAKKLLRELGPEHELVKEIKQARADQRTLRDQEGVDEIRARDLDNTATALSEALGL